MCPSRGAGARGPCARTDATATRGYYNTRRTPQSPAPEQPSAHESRQRSASPPLSHVRPMVRASDPPSGLQSAGRQASVRLSAQAPPQHALSQRGSSAVSYAQRRSYGSSYRVPLRPHVTIWSSHYVVILNTEYSATVLYSTLRSINVNESYKYSVRGNLKGGLGEQLG